MAKRNKASNVAGIGGGQHRKWRGVSINGEESYYRQYGVAKRLTAAQWQRGVGGMANRRKSMAKSGHHRKWRREMARNQKI
jgi:hypothetical protein